MHIRKLVKAGQASHTISLPRKWLLNNNLKKGDTVYITEKSSKELILRSQPHEEAQEKKEITIEVDGKELGTVQRQLTSAYLNNYNIIHLLGSSIAQNAKAYRNLFQDFVALEIAEQTSKKITAHDLLNLQEISVEKTINRMDMMVRTMLEDLGHSITKPELHDSIALRDFDINRQYFLLLRLLKNAMKNPAMADRLHVSHDKIIAHWYTTVNIENLGDCIKNISALLPNAAKLNTAEFTKILSAIQADYTNAMKAYATDDKALADTIARRRTTLFDQCQTLATKHSGHAEIGIIESLKNMTSLVANVARTVIDED